MSFICPHCGEPIDIGLAGAAIAALRRTRRGGPKRRVQHSESCKSAKGPRCIECRAAGRGKPKGFAALSTEQGAEIREKRKKKE